MLASLASGLTPVVVGTHALLQPDVEFRDLALVVIDEQHRFGVEQRLTIAAKGRMMVGSGTMTGRVESALGFALTGAQRLAIAEIAADMAQPRRIMRVGCAMSAAISAIARRCAPVSAKPSPVSTGPVSTPDPTSARPFWRRRRARTRATASWLANTSS